MRSRFFLIVFIAATQAFSATLFDRVVAKGKGLEIKASEVDDTFIAFKASRAANGQPVPQTPDDTKKIENEILDSLIAQKLLLARATEADRTNGIAEATRFVEEKKKQAPSEAAFRRQLIVSGMTVEQFEKEIRDQGIIKSVIERELRSKQNISDADVEKFYQDNLKSFEEPEKWKIAHIYMSNRNPTSRAEISEKEKTAKKAKLDEVLLRARANVDFGKLARESSEHNLTRDAGGEQIIVRGQMPPEFEAAALSMKPGQISDVVTTGLGWHIIKYIEHIPAKTNDLASAKEKIKETLLQQATQKALPDFVKQLRKEAGVEIVAEAKQ